MFLNTVKNVQKFKKKILKSQQQQKSKKSPQKIQKIKKIQQLQNPPKKLTKPKTFREEQTTICENSSCEEIVPYSGSIIQVKLNDTSVSWPILQPSSSPATRC
jgi:hypothetical protein